MYAINFTDARKNLASVMNGVVEDHAPMMISRQGAEPVVMMSLADYNAMQATMHLLKSPKNATRLMQAISDHRAGLGQERELPALVD